MPDSLIMVPFEPVTSVFLEADVRTTYLSRIALPLEAATYELEEALGLDLDYWKPGRAPRIGKRELTFPITRTLTSVVLASALEGAGLSWTAIDPGIRELDWWRARLRRQRADPPRCIALSTTFVMNAPWLRALLAVIRRQLPGCPIIVGGAYYASNAKNFLSLDAEVFCVGDGEHRLPQIVRAIRDGASLDGIPGLYLADRGNGLRHTGAAQLVPLSQRPRIDWRLADRVEPAVNLQSDLLEVGVETQRGCVFKCEFCSYRTLSPPNALSPSEAADAIMDTALARNGVINIFDATASFPHARWQALLRELIGRGGSPHPIWAFARVSDISEESARLMAAAGVRHVFVGQESGDQRILNAMKKGTRVEHVRPAVERLARYGIIGTFAFIHGFPGENAESVAATRDLICRLNDGHENRPAVLTYLINPFSVPDFASVSGWNEFRNVSHHFNYGGEGHDDDRAFDEVLDTVLAVSRVAHAPAYAHLFFKTVMPTTGSSVFTRHDPMRMFRWLKAVERGIAIFLERRLEGTPPDDRELRRVGDVIREAYPLPRRAPIARQLFGVRVIDRLQREWEGEREKGIGIVTRSYLGATLLRQTRDLRLGLHALRTGDIAGNAERDRRRAELAADHASKLVMQAHTMKGKIQKEARVARNGN